MLLAGPSLRKTTKSEIYIWMALKKIPDTLIVSLGTEQNVNSYSSIAISETSYLKLGDNIQAVLVKLVPAIDSFPEDTKLFYNIELNGDELYALGLLNNGSSIGINLPGDSLPSLFIPKKHTQIIYGSCRKPHAGKTTQIQFDQFQNIDKELCAVASDLSERASMLCLTGDQIYADDVALPLLCGIQQKALELFGEPVKLPRATLAGRDIDVSAIKYCNRTSKLKNIGFSSGHAENHLMTLDEYVCMYLAVMGGTTIDMPAYKDIAHNIKIETVTKRIQKKRVKIRRPAITLDDYNEQKVRIEKFLKIAKLCRRVMANIPTYTMFDDHEVTDDWNLTKFNQINLRNNSLSSRIQSNALFAYWAFQGWGNNPQVYNNSQMENFHLLRSPLTNKKLSDIQALLIDNDYSYEVLGSPHLVSIDTRTQRQTTALSPSLLNDHAFDRLEKRFLKLAETYDNNSQQSLLLISPAPVLGFKSVELLQFLAKIVPNFSDNETWIGCKKAYDRLIKIIQTLPFNNCCILSGDVHYAFVRYLERKNSNAERLNIYQLTSSSIHNSPSGTARFILDALSHAEQAMFRRKHTPYLMPNEDNNEIINGHTNFGQLTFVNGQPVENKFLFNALSEGDPYAWHYDLTNLAPFN